MKKKISLGLLILFLFSLVNAVPPDGWHEANPSDPDQKFNYYIGIQGATDRERKPPQYLGSSFLYDIDIYRAKTSDGNYIDPITGKPTEEPHFRSELQFCIFFGWCLPIVGNDVVITRAWVEQNPQAPDEGNKVFVEIWNNNAGEVTAFALDAPLTAQQVGGTETIECSSWTDGTGASVTSIPANTTVNLECEIAVPAAGNEYAEGIYVTDAKITSGSIAFEAGCTACRNTAYGDTARVNFVVGQGFTGFPIPETSPVIVVLVALAVLFIVGRKRQ